MFLLGRGKTGADWIYNSTRSMLPQLQQCSFSRILGVLNCLIIAISIFQWLLWCIYAYLRLMMISSYVLGYIMDTFLHDHCVNILLFYKLSVFSIYDSGPIKVHHVSLSDHHPSCLMPTMPIDMATMFHPGRQETNMAISFVLLGYSNSFHSLPIATSVFKCWLPE